MSWTTPSAHIFATSEVVTASTMNTYIQANLTFLGVGFGGQMNQTTTQAIPTGTSTLIKFDTIIYDPNGMCTTGAAAKITIPANAGGVYAISWAAGIGTASAFQQEALLMYNGSVLQAAFAPTTGSAVTIPSGSTIRQLNPTDTIAVNLLHNAGASGNTYITSPVSFLGCHLLSPN